MERGAVNHFNYFCPKPTELPKDNLGRGECEPAFTEQPSDWTTGSQIWARKPHVSTRCMSVSVRHPSLIGELGKDEWSARARVGFRSRNRSMVRMEAFNFRGRGDAASSASTEHPHDGLDGTMKVFCAAPAKEKHIDIHGIQSCSWISAFPL